MLTRSMRKAQVEAHPARPIPQGPSRSTYAPWEALPTELLGPCLLSGDPSDRMSAFATCKSFAKAMLGSGWWPQLRLNKLDSTQSNAVALRLLASWDVAVDVVLNGSEAPEALSLKPLLSLLAQTGVSLPRAEWIRCDHVLLDTYGPAGLATIFPNMNELQLNECQIEDGMLPLAGCSNLELLSLERQPLETVSCHAGWLPQLQQLASLPSLTSLSFPPHEYSPTFLPLCATQLTELILEYVSCPDNWTYEQHVGHWQLALDSAAQCTNLRKLRVSPCTVQQVGALMSSLPHLQDLDLQQCDYQLAGGSTEGLASTLLQYTQLTSLSCFSLEGLQQCHADSPCSWQQLRLQQASPALLSRLPLHSLTEPLQLRQLLLGEQATVADVQAAASNLARSKAPYVMSKRLIVNFYSREREIEQYLDTDSTAALLQAAAPLLPRDLEALTLEQCWVGEHAVGILQQVRGPGITTLNFNFCGLMSAFWVQVARSFPHTKALNFYNPRHVTAAAEVMAYFWALPQEDSSTEAGQDEAPRVWFSLDTFYYPQVTWEESLGDVNEQLELLGVRGSVEMRFFS